VGVKLCANSDEVARHAKDLLRQRRNERGVALSRRILVESVAEGPEYLVEAFSNSIIGITKKYLGPPPHFVEVGHDYPAAVSDSARTAIEEATLSALDALKLFWGPVHIELRLSEDGPKIIEVNPRLAGGYIPELVRLASGIDLISQTIRAVTGGQPKIEAQMNRHASISFILPQQEGTLVSVEGIDKARQVADVVEVRLYQEVGSRVFLRGDFRDRVGHVISCSETDQAARYSVQTARKAIKLSVH